MVSMPDPGYLAAVLVGHLLWLQQGIARDAHLGLGWCCRVWGKGGLRCPVQSLGREDPQRGEQVEAVPLWRQEVSGCALSAPQP